MTRLERTIVCGNPATLPPPLTLLSEEERIATFFRSAECVGKPPAVPSKNPTNGVAGNSSGPRFIK